MNDQARGALLVMGAAFLWGTLGIIAKSTYSQTTVGPISLALFRLLFALPVLGLFALSRHYQVSLTRREVALFAAFGFISLTAYQSLFFTSFAYTSVQHAAALLYTGPAFVAVLSRFILKERLSRSKIVAVALSVSGAFLILGLFRNEPLFSSRTQIGDLLAIGSGLAYASWYVFGKVLGENREAAVTSFLALFFGAVFLFPLTIVLEGLRLPEGMLAWELVGVVGIVPTAIAYILYLTGLKLIEATKASVFAIVEPLTAAILAFLIFHETLSYDSFIGFGLIISSIILISRSSTVTEIPA